MPKTRSVIPKEITEEPKKIYENFRGIRTSPIPRNETIAKTIKNRFNQISISLPRIDDKKRWAGFPGLTGWARQIAKLIPVCDYYVEPFAGAAKVAQEFLRFKDKNVGVVLNDKSRFVFNWLEKEFKGKVMTVKNNDFRYIVNFYDSPKAFFLLDQPWNKDFYLQNFACFDRKNVAEYDDEILDLCKNLQGKFIITTRKENQRMLDSEYNKYLIKSEYVVSGHYPELLLTTNLNLKGLKKLKC